MATKNHSTKVSLESVMRSIAADPASGRRHWSEVWENAFARYSDEGSPASWKERALRDMLRAEDELAQIAAAERLDARLFRTLGRIGL